MKMLFSKRNKIAQAAYAWCVARKIPTHPLNIVTALVDLGIINDDAEQSVQADVDMPDELTKWE